MEVKNAIEILQESKRENEIMRDNPTIFWRSIDMESGIQNAQRRIEAINTALTALRSMQEAGEPLSLEQLKQMDGKPVWIEDKEYPENTGWVIWDDSFKQNWLGDPETQNSHGKSWLAYSYTPAHIDRSEWEKCELCSLTDGKPASRLILAETCNGEAKYCPRCGRPLAEEAWAELERRLRG